ncbi:MAG TPA: response regulator [Candidatus Polarisedimenticolia bacterium]|nr:response regulator [Candidatus Polarisedimenticolia bacterium]
MNGIDESSGGKAPWDILVIDDEPVVRDGMRRILELRGLRVATAADGNEALAHPALGQCRMVFCDLVLPDVSGLVVIDEIRKTRTDLPVILITGYATVEQVDRAREAGASSFLAKPFEESELVAAVEAALGSGAPAFKESGS